MSDVDRAIEALRRGPIPGLENISDSVGIQRGVGPMIEYLGGDQKNKRIMEVAVAILLILAVAWKISEPPGPPGHKTPGHKTPGHKTPGHKTPGHKAPGHKTPEHKTPGPPGPPGPVVPDERDNPLLRPVSLYEQKWINYFREDTAPLVTDKTLPQANGLVNMDIINPSTVAKNPDVLFIFGENTQHKGTSEYQLSTQAVIRSYKKNGADYKFPNTIGVRTTDRRPSKSPPLQVLVEQDTKEILDAIGTRKYRAVVMPRRGLGTGIAQLFRSSSFSALELKLLAIPRQIKTKFLELQNDQPKGGFAVTNIQVPMRIAIIVICIIVCLVLLQRIHDRHPGGICRHNQQFSNYIARGNTRV